MSLVIRSDEGNYKTKAYDFVIADDLYIFFKFRSPKSMCEIGIAYDQFVDGGDWYLHNGDLRGQDHKIVDDIVWNRLMRTPEFAEFDMAVSKAARKFNERV